MSPITRRLIQFALIAFMAGTVALVVGFALYPPIGVIAMAITGRGPSLCDLRQTYDSYARRLRSNHYQAIRFPQVRRVRTEGSLQLIETEWGPFWEEATEGSVITAQLAESDAKYENFGGTPIRKGDIVFDCGANSGTQTRFAIRQGAKKVIAVEPAPINVEALRRTFAKEIADGTVVVVPKGVWDREDTLTLSRNSDTAAMDSLVMNRESKGSVTVPLTTIDKIVADLGLERVDFIKMDTEGAERQILAGARETLRRWKPRLEISFHLPDDAEQIPEAIRAARSDYRHRCLLCVADWNAWRVSEDILFFE